MTLPAVDLQSAAKTHCTVGNSELDFVYLEAVYRAQAGFVWRNARRLGCDDALAEDVTHEVFLVVARRLNEFRNEASIRTWLFAITYRSVQRLMRDRALHQRRLREYAADQVQVPESHPEARSEAGQYLRHLLGHLDECKRVVFILAELEGMTSIEIGRVLGLKPATVDSRLRAARKTITHLMKHEADKQQRAP